MKRLVYSFKNFLKEKYPFPVRKLQIHTNLGCPHRKDRTGDSGGCAYCYNPGFSNVENSSGSVERQIRRGIDRSRKQGFEGKFLAYFQTYTNTYADLPLLKSWWHMIYDYPDDIVGLAIGTRPDCLPPEILSALAEISENRMVWLELGLQSAHDRTLELINRGHDYQCFVDAINRVKQYPDILICAHIILGLPGEDLGDMQHTIFEINKLQLEGVKLHHLQIVKNTMFAKWYAEGKIPVFAEEEYLGLLKNLLPYLSPEIVVHRLIGDIQDDLLIAPRWKTVKSQLIQKLYREMQEEGIYQGKYAMDTSDENESKFDFYKQGD
ncbi:TIGR01212 family radical SAM protein [candidate division KSB1 bacterium]|nr:TIGR01212 family radical SAM protein [candidate division KSB1 bacterium]